MCENTSGKPEISHCENRSVLKRLRLESSHCENTIHEEGRGGGGGGGEGGEEMQQTRPRLESSHVNTEYVRKEEEEEEEEKEEERRKEEEGAGDAQEKQEPHTKDVVNKPFSTHQEIRKFIQQTKFDQKLSSSFAA